MDEGPGGVTQSELNIQNATHDCGGANRSACATKNKNMPSSARTLNWAKCGKFEFGKWKIRRLVMDQWKLKKVGATFLAEN